MKATTMSMHPGEDFFDWGLLDWGQRYPKSPDCNGRSKPPHFRQNFNLSTEVTSLLKSLQLTHRLTGKFDRSVRLPYFPNCNGRIKPAHFRQNFSLSPEVTSLLPSPQLTHQPEAVRLLVGSSGSASPSLWKLISCSGSKRALLYCPDKSISY